MLRRLIGEDVTLRTALAEDTWNVLADPSQLEQVVVNLAVNARDAMPRGGVLTIETSNIVLDEAYCHTRIGATVGPHVAIAVTDTGEGMTPEIMARLFEPFFTTKPQGKGTGLGLATCHGIVQQNGGHIAVYSEPGRGTSVKVFLPRIKDVAADAAAAAAAPEPPPRGGTETILLAEDSDIVRDLAEAALKGAGYTVLTAVDGRQAVEMAAGHADMIDLLVTDVVMPEMNGVEMAKVVTKARPGMPVIFMSGYTEETIAYHGVETDRHIFMAKPFMTDMLLRKVREVLDATRRK
jgi:CheY-like chemotaxis protein